MHHLRPLASWLAAVLVVSGAVVARSQEPAAPPVADPTVAAPSPIPVAQKVAMTAAPARLVLEVLLANDPDFPEVTAAQADAIFTHAKETLADKLGFSELEFRIKGNESVTAFLARNAPPGDACLAQFEPSRLRPGARAARDVDAAAVQRFLSRWSVDALQAFFPESERGALTSYEVIGARLLSELDRKVQLIGSFVLPNGKSLLTPDRVDDRSYVRWICAMRNQNDADLVLTNAFVLYDLATEPFPHTVFQKCKVGGSSLASPRRRAIRGRAVMASTFSMVTSLPFFREEGVETLGEEEKLAVIGTFIVAHELGHAVFKLPDFYDHPRECLMTTKYETGYVNGYRDLKAFPGACSACEPYVEAKREVFKSDAARAEGRFAEAIEHMKAAVRLTPKHVDGSYLRYMADLSLDVAELYAATGDVTESERWLKAALRIVPDHPGAAAIQSLLAGLRDNSIKNKEKN